MGGVYRLLLAVVKLTGDPLRRLPGWLILLLIWLMGAVVDRLWFACDHAVPAWDQAEYLSAALRHWQALQTPHWFSGDWWIKFWQINAKFPPLTFIATAPFLSGFGLGVDSATLVNLFVSLVLLGSVYGLGVCLFNPQMGLWATGLCLLMPELYKVRLDYLLDYPLVAMVTLSFYCLTRWWYAKTKSHCWGWSLAVGLSLGLAFLSKQTALLFLFIPLVWVGGVSLIRRAWERLAQLVMAVGLSSLVWGPWYRTNWLLILSGSKRATIDSAIAEGDPALNTLDAWTYYWQQFPRLVSWTLLIVPLVGLLLLGLKTYVRIPGLGAVIQPPKFPVKFNTWVWLAVFLGGAYVLSSLNINKDNRYVAPYLPVVALVLAYGLSLWSGRWRVVRWGAFSIAVGLTVLNLFAPANVPGSSLVSWLSPSARHVPQWESAFPHPQVIAEILKTEPYLRHTLAVLPSTAELNQHNFSFYGALANFQVYGRQVGTRERRAVQDARSLDWYLTKSNNQGSIRKRKAQAKVVQRVEQGAELTQLRTWTLPAGDVLKLYHRRQPSVQVQRLDQPLIAEQVRLDRVGVPAQAPPGQPIPVTYEWSGRWQQLRSGLVLLTWQRQDIAQESQSGSPFRWWHDHGIGMGALRNTQVAPDQAFRVTERTAMLPPLNASPGTYVLSGIYLNRITGMSYPLTLPAVRITIAPTASPSPAPELDLVTQLQQLAPTLSQGRTALDHLFAEIARIDQYDAVLDYTSQTQQACQYRLQQEPNNLNLIYGLVLSSALQRQVQPTIAALERAIQLEPENPWNYGYLAFVHVYTLSPGSAQTALKPALALRPQQPEFRLLQGAADFMQGNFLGAWAEFQQFNAAGGSL
jgi:4-amino-4-deoxy-L-arabinose transferase-like glycosyltransferase